MLVDVEATAENAEAISSNILAKLRELGLITGELNEDCVLGGMGFSPGPAIHNLYNQKHKSASPLPYGLSVCGVEPNVGRDFNWSALGPTFHHLTCPACGAKIEDEGSHTFQSIAENIDIWLKDSNPSPVQCPKCKEPSSIFKWQCKEPLALGYVSFKFWNWPPFESPPWKIDIPELIRELTGHKIVVSYGHL